MFSLAMGPMPRSRLRFGWAVAASVSEWKRFHSPIRQAQGPESLDRLGTLSLSKRPVEGLTLAATSEMKKSWHLGLSEHDGSFHPTGFQPGHFCGFTRKVEERIARNSTGANRLLIPIAHRIETQTS